MAELRSVSTPWTDILEAQNNPVLMAECLERLAEKYRAPIHAFILRTLRVNRPEIADDLVQQFFLHFIESDALKALDRERGRLRNWFAVSVQRFVWDEMKKGSRKNAASPFCKLERLPAGDIVLADKSSPNPEEEFNRQWAREVFDDAIMAFRRYCRDKGKQHYYQVFERHVLSGEKDVTPSYEETAAALAISVKDVSNYLGRARKRFQSLLREQVRATVGSDEEVDDELRDMLRYFG